MKTIKRDVEPNEGRHSPKPKKSNRPKSNVPEATNSHHAEPEAGKAGPDTPEQES